MTDVESIKKHQKAFLEKAKGRKEPINFIIEGLELQINPNVFPPATDTKLLISNISSKKGERILDLTTGSGAVATKAGIGGATGFAVDINPSAVINANENFKKYGVEIEAIQSNLFENVPTEKFDQIFANGPFFEGDITDPMDYACYGAKAFIDGLFSGVRDYLKEDGKMLLVMSAWSDLQHFEDSAKENKLSTSKIASRKSDDGERIYHLYELRAKRS